MKNISKHKDFWPFLLTILLVLVVYVWNYGLWPETFDSQWDEEVQLHDGRVITVHMTAHYLRRGRLRLFPNDNVQYRSNELSFVDQGQKNHVKEGQRFVALDYLDRNWYVAVRADGANYQWATLYSPESIGIAEITGNKLIPREWDEVSDLVLRQKNLLGAPLARAQSTSVISLLDKKNALQVAIMRPPENLVQLYKKHKEAQNKAQR
jgi:hypothetical protein